MGISNSVKIFTSVLGNKPDPFLKTLTFAEQYLVLALYIYIRHSEVCDEQGWFQLSMRRLIKTWFGYKGGCLKSFLSGRKSSGLFEHNGLLCEDSRYRVIVTAELNVLTRQYEAFVVKYNRLQSNVGGKVSGEGRIVELWDAAEAANHGAGTDEPVSGMSLAHLQHMVADHQAGRICAEMENDPKLIRLIAEGLYMRLHYLNNQ